MITPRSALKFDLFAEASRQHKRDEVGDPLQAIARHIDFGELARLVDALIERGDVRRGGRPAYPTEVMVRILVLKRLYNLSDEQMEYQLLDRASY
ncbi:Transposase domain, partial [Paracidovorax cattleyae]